jgi:hypothetical protein
MTFTHENRVYTIDRGYTFRGEIWVETHFVENGQGIGKTWKLAELETSAPAVPA